MKKESVTPLKRIDRQNLPFECVALMLQGGGALGSYQAGVYEAMAEIDLHPDWVAGISIGAINAAIIAGNAPEKRVEKLKAFWDGVTANPFLDWAGMADFLTPQGYLARSFYNQWSAGLSMANGANTFFTPRPFSPYFQPDGSVEATSFYDTSLLKATLEKLTDFDRINHRETRLSVSAVNIKTGNFTIFDNTDATIGPEHIIASCSLPPGFAATEIDGEFYWDGGLVSNTPLQWVLEGDTRQDTLAFQVDLWPARGKMPRNLIDVANRQKEIQYSSRTRASTDSFKHRQHLRCLLATLMSEIPEPLRHDERFADLCVAADHKQYNLVHLIYRSRQYEGNAKDYDFSRLAMSEHWQSGIEDARSTLAHDEIYTRPGEKEGVATYDFNKYEDEKILKSA